MRRTSSGRRVCRGRCQSAGIYDVASANTRDDEACHHQAHTEALIRDVPVVHTAAAALQGLGFATPIPAGSYSAIFERAAASMSYRISPNRAAKGDLIFFEMGGPNTAELRSVLGDVANSTGITVEIFEWTPPLS